MEDSMTQPVSDVKEMVTYQDGSIVSKEIIKKPTGTVTIFAFDQGQGLSEHTAPFDALVQIVDGEAEIIISGESHHLKEGEIINKITNVSRRSCEVIHMYEVDLYRWNPENLRLNQFFSKN